MFQFPIVNDIFLMIQGDLDEFVKALLDGNVSPNYKPTSILNPPILVAARKGTHSKIMKMLSFT